MNESKIEGLQTADVRITADVARLKKEWDIAEGLAKEVEEFLDEAGLPPINELRYCGKHAIYAFDEYLQTGKHNIDDLGSAIRHARRAAYEAGEAGILSALTLIGVFKDKYHEVVISDVVTDWTKILVRCDEVRDEVSQARQSGEDRSNDHAKYMEIFKELRGYCKILNHSEDDLKKKIVESQTSRRNFLLATLIALFGIVLTVVFGIIPLVDSP